MKCLSPLRVYYTLNYSFDKKVVRKASTGHTEPFYGHSTSRIVPCGKCPACLSQNASEWSMRLSHENIYYGYGRSSMFLTLTYSDENLPDNRSVSVRDTQLFYKRLRKRCEARGIRIKHFTVSEYGGLHARPHYHSIIYGLSYFRQDHEKLIKESWNKGFYYIGTVQQASIKYVTKYISKQRDMRFSRHQYLEVYGKERPFRTMSHGLGKRWLDENYENVEEFENITYEGFQCSIPRTYMHWMRKYLDYDFAQEMFKKNNNRKIKEYMDILKISKIDLVRRFLTLYPHFDKRYDSVDIFEDIDPLLKAHYGIVRSRLRHDYQVRSERYQEYINSKNMLNIF